MRLLGVLLKWTVLGAVACIVMQQSALRAQDAEEAVQVFVPDGQVKSHLIRVFVNREMTVEMNPRLRFIGSHLIGKKHPGEDSFYEPAVVAPRQRWVQEVAGQQIAFTGTLLLFDLCHFPIPFWQAMTRVTPTLTWKEYGIEQNAVGANEVNLAQIPSVIGWTLVLLVVVAGFIVLLARRVKHKAIYLFCGPDGGLSLWRTQIAAWTMAIGGTVVGYGLIRLDIPDIPNSLVALMGLSLATGGISYVKGKEVEDKIRQQRGTEFKGWPRWSCLISDKEGPRGKEELSIAKAQMVLWTCLMLALFIVKSALEGVLWDVPWEMVALMGMSQAGYVSPKLDLIRARGKTQAEETAGGS